MKKMMCVIFVLIVLVAGNQKNNDFSLLDYFSGTYTAYTSTSSGVDCVDLGFCYMNSKPTTKDVVGESMILKNFEIGEAIKLLNARVVKTEYLEDGTTVIYAFTNLIDKKVQVEGKHVNIQIAVHDEQTIVGWPLILGSF